MVGALLACTASKAGVKSCPTPFSAKGLIIGLAVFAVVAVFAVASMVFARISRANRSRAAAPRG